MLQAGRQGLETDRQTARGREGGLGFRSSPFPFSLSLLLPFLSSSFSSRVQASSLSLSSLPSLLLNFFSFHLQQLRTTSHSEAGLFLLSSPKPYPPPPLFLALSPFATFTTLFSFSSFLKFHPSLRRKILTLIHNVTTYTTLFHDATAQS